MKISARNVFAGKVVAIKKGEVTAHVTLEVNGLEVMASITNEALADLGLTVGAPATAIIKATSVLLATE